jgi:hypothetical protein
MIELGENASDENSAQVSNAENSDNCDCFMFVLGEDKLGKNMSLCGSKKTKQRSGKETCSLGVRELLKNES